MGKINVTIIGAGNGGMAAAADLSIRGHKVTLYELPEFKETLKSIQRERGIYLKTLESSGLTGGFASLKKITINIEEAIESAEVILIIVPSYAHKVIAQKIAPFLKENQSIVLAPGNMGGSIEFYHTLIENGGTKKIAISEFESMMYACRRLKSNQVYIRGYKRNLGFSTFPAVKIDEHYKIIKELYPYILKRRNVLETGLSNCNPILHVPIMLFNLSLVDRGVDTLMYHDALTKSISKIVEQLDFERRSINEKIKAIQLKPLKYIIRSWYSHQGAFGETFDIIAGKNPIYYTSMLPHTFDHRYITEDIPYGLIPMISFLKKFNINPVRMKLIVQLINDITGKDFHVNARTIQTLNLQDLSKEELIEYVEYR